jgi:hypothetical protein
MSLHHPMQIPWLTGRREAESLLDNRLKGCLSSWVPDQHRGRGAPRLEPRRVLSML